MVLRSWTISGDDRGSIRQLAVQSNDRAVANARCAATELSRARVERHEVELYLSDRYAEPVPVAVVVVTR